MAKHIIKAVTFLHISTMLCVTVCSQSLSGKYVSCKKGNFDNASFILNRDSTFSYQVATELRGNATFYGHWHLRKDTIVLKIVKPFDDDSLIKKEYVICRDTILPDNSSRITIIQEDTVPFILAKLFINDNDTPVALNVRAQAILKSEIKSVRIKYQGLKDREFLLNSTRCNDFIVMMYDKQFIPMIYLIPIRKWLVRKNGLLPLDENNHPYLGYMYKKAK